MPVTAGPPCSPTPCQPVRDAAGKLKPSPVIDAYNLLAVRAGCPDPGVKMRYPPTAEDEADADRVWRDAGLSRYREVICLNPGAAFGAAKHWPTDYFAALARDLAEKRGAGVLVLCGPAERPLSQEIAAKANHPAVHALGDLATPVRLDGPPLVAWLDQGLRSPIQFAGDDRQRPAPLRRRL